MKIYAAGSWMLETNHRALAILQMQSFYDFDGRIKTGELFFLTVWLIIFFGSWLEERGRLLLLAIGLFRRQHNWVFPISNEVGEFVYHRNWYIQADRLPWYRPT